MVDIKEIPGAVEELKLLAERYADCAIDKALDSVFYIALQGQDKVSLDCSHLSQNGMLLAAKILAQSPSLKVLELQNNNLGANGVAVASILATSLSLQSIDISANALGEHAIGVVQHLTNLKTLKELDLGLNDIKDYGMRVAQEIIMLNSLKHLDIYANDLKTEIAICIAKSPSIFFLNMSDNEIGASYAEAIDSVIISSNIHRLQIRDNGLSADNKQSAQDITSRHNMQCAVERQGMQANLEQILILDVQDIVLQYVGHHIELEC